MMTMTMNLTMDIKGRKGRKGKPVVKIKKGKKKKKRKKADSGEESDFGFDEDGGGNDSDYTSKKSRKSRNISKHNSSTTEQDSNSGMPTIEEVCETFGLTDVEVEYSDSDFQNLTTYKLFQQHVRPSLAKEIPKVTMYLSELTPTSMYTKQVSIMPSRKRRLVNSNVQTSKSAEPEPMFQKLTANLPEGWPRKAVQATCEYLYLFMATSSIHGFNHLTTMRRSLWEYILWLIFLIMACAGAVSIGLSTWQRYQENPTVITLERDSQEWNTTFPSTTICPTKKSAPNLIDQYAKSHMPDMQTEMKEFLFNLTNATYYSFGDVVDDPSKSILSSDFLEIVYQNRYQFDYKVVDSDDQAPSSVILHMTEMGVCYSYNSAIAVYNNPNVWLENEPVRTDVRLISGNILDGDLFSQVMDMNSPINVYIHDSWETPDCATRKLALPDKKYKTLDMSALSVYIAEETTKLSIRQRKCRMFEESNLELSPVYSYNLCRMECRMKQALKLCNCAPYFYKPLPDVPVCDSVGMRCLANYSEKLVRLQEPHSDDERQIDCKCLPSCESVKYVIEMQSDMPWFLGTNFKWSLTRYPLMSLKRDVLFGFTDVLVSIGGTAGLFLGCSLLSFMEIFYFCTLRLFFHIFNWKN